MNNKIEMTCDISKQSVFSQMAGNTVSDDEHLRELLANAIDAKARNVKIASYIDAETKGHVLEVTDDGVGMGLEEVKSFFNLGVSQKDYRLIGEKGLGTIILFNSGRVEVETKNGDKAYLAILDQPGIKLQNGIELTFTIEEISGENLNIGTKIKIYDLKVYKPTKVFNGYRMKDNILWRTAAGSFKDKLLGIEEAVTTIGNIDIVPTITIQDQINDINETFQGRHIFASDKPTSIEDRSDSRWFSKSYGPYSKTGIVNGKKVSLQIYGEVAGYEIRNKIVLLRQGEGHKSRYGIWLCKDGIPIENIKDELLGDANYSHFHILVNSQNFQLNTDRSKITNIESLEVDWIKETAKKFIIDYIYKDARDTYFTQVNLESEEAEVQRKKEEVKKWIDNYEQMEDLLLPGIPVKKVPTNEAQTVVLLAAMFGAGLIKNMVIGSYSSYLATDMILEKEDGIPILTEIEYKASRFLLHKHPLSTVQMLICYINDLKVGTFFKQNGSVVEVVSKNDKKYLKYGTNWMIEIIELKGIIEKIKNG